MLLALAISETIWLALIGVLTIAVKEYFDSKRAERAEAKADKVVEVTKKSTQVTEKRLESIAKVGEKTHTLVNSNMGVQLKLNAAVTKRLADLTNDADDRKAAELAQSMWEEHEKKQHAVDVKEAKDAGIPIAEPEAAKVVFVVEDEGNKKALVIKAADAVNDPDVQRALKDKEDATEGQG